MNKEIKNKWVAALKSGEYEQGRAKLRTDDNKFCCLGVLCDLYTKEKGIEWSRDVITGHLGLPRAEASANGQTATTGLLSPEVMEWSGLSRENPTVTHKMNDEEKSTELARVNDHVGLDFNQIADLIEAQL